MTTKSKPNIFAQTERYIIAMADMEKVARQVMTNPAEPKKKRKLRINNR